MSTRSAIENTLYRYAWSYDMDEMDGMGACFTEDAEVVFSTGLEVGRDAVVGELQRRRSQVVPGTVPWHVITNVFIREETAEEAVVASWYTFVVQDTEGTAILRSIGYYDDVFVNEGDAWRVKRRRVLDAGVR
jgi:3-phenylpropionate/cinnamic acid dioxygenase small subunit